MSDKYAVMASYAQHMVDTGRDVAPFTSQEIVELLAERDADRARIAELEKWVRGVEESMISASDRAESAEKRVAELEARVISTAATDVLAERQRQIDSENWTPERDDAYLNSELADAAACYALHAHNQGFSTPVHWPWDSAWWKQTNPRRDLVKAGALILAEIERIDRAAGISLKIEGE